MLGSLQVGRMYFSGGFRMAGGPNHPFIDGFSMIFHEINHLIWVPIHLWKAPFGNTEPTPRPILRTGSLTKTARAQSAVMSWHRRMKR